MRQRIGIARTLLPNPSVILLDEPSAGLDPAGRVQFRQLLCNLRDQGKALIVSSHILSDMGEYCTHAGIMSRGKMVQFGTVSHVAAHGGDGRCRYTMRLARPVNGLKETLAGIENLNSVEIDNQHVVFEYLTGADHAAVLLAELVKQEIPIASFAPHTAGLEEAYLRAGIAQVD